MQGLNRAVVEVISKQKQEPAWMRQKRFEALEVFEKAAWPRFGIDQKELDLEKINYFNSPKDLKKKNWSQVDKKIKKTFERLGIPQAERRVLAGVGAQWDSTMVYQNFKQRLKKQGVVFGDMDEAVKKYPRLVKKYFMTQAVTINNNKFSALHGAVWSGGSFVYVPKGVKVKEPVQGYFWLNLERGGQFEHTIIIAEAGAQIHYIEGCSAPKYSSQALHSGVVEIFVGKGAKVRYSTIQNWTKNIYNLATKRAIVETDGTMEWVSASLGSKLTMVYPCSVLKGDRAKSDHLSLSLAGKGQVLDTGGKVIHAGKDTGSNIVSKSISQAGGKTVYRGSVKILPGAKGAKSSVSCESLILDKRSQAVTVPKMEVLENEVVAMHEAKTGKIAEEELNYLMSRGLAEAEAMAMIVNGFMEPVVKQLPLEYAVEMNRLIEMEMEGSVG
ncbi:MAG: Fe-S cluster assembly protein SufB [Candidatus Beckwithbacteria bacterium]